MDEPEMLRRRLARWRDAPRRRPADVPRPGPGEESVWDYPRPPRVEAVAQRVHVEIEGRTLADTSAALRVLETAGAPAIYVPPRDVERALLVPAPGSSLCEWKGRARYWSARLGDRVAPEVAWSYPQPFPEYAQLADHYAFYPDRAECFLGGARAAAQPGGFYGGWVTPGILGPFKGGPGSEGW
jgi:uncharacterized protein (DUF427 family)